MRLANIETKNGLRLCVKSKAGYTDISDALGTGVPLGIKALFADERLLATAAELSEEEGTEYPKKAFKAIVTQPGRILCLGLNYRAHAAQMGKDAALNWPEIFLRHSGTIIGPHEDLIKPHFSRRFQFEGELGMVIGKEGRFIREKEARNHVAGFVALNDATEREWQRASTQWTCGKNFDATFALGSEMLTPDEIDPMNLRLRTTLNNTVVQESNTSEMIMNVWRAVEFLSGITSLHPGDIIATGTPAILGDASGEAVFLQNGDKVSVSIQDIGELTNNVREEPAGPTEWPWIPWPDEPKSVR
jgi:2-keto-4-pentenoate hydratase/2-oxohepta-3-ene-1,7-dioic acid hydratase in catechol pathway